MKKKKLKIMLALLLAIAAFLQPMQIRAYFMADKYKHSVYNNMDKDEYTKYGSYGDVGDWVKCGNFYYECFDPHRVSASGKKYITIRKVEEAALKNGVLTIPSELDGYQVLGVGAFNVELKSNSDFPYTEFTENCCILEKPELLRKVIFSEGIEVIGMRSFQGCNNLLQVTFPQSLVYIAFCAFNGCQSIAELAFPQGTVVGDFAFDSLQARKTTLYANCTLPVLFEPNHNKKIKSVVRINYYEKDYYEYTMMGYLEKIYVAPGITKFSLSAETYGAIEPDKFVDFYLKRLIINARCTNLKIQDGINIYGLAGIYTVKGANAIKEAKKHGIPYFVKKTGKIQVVKAKKKSGQYKASWKKVKTKVERHRDYNNWKGELLKKAVKTKYKVYGRSQKSDSYKKICTTAKTSIKSKYKYIKAVPVKEWE